jgi:hypothetical protein
MNILIGMQKKRPERVCKLMQMILEERLNPVSLLDDSSLTLTRPAPRLPVESESENEADPVHSPPLIVYILIFKQPLKPYPQPTLKTLKIQAQTSQARTHQQQRLLRWTRQDGGHY